MQTQSVAYKSEMNILSIYVVRYRCRHALSFCDIRSLKWTWIQNLCLFVLNVIIFAIRAETRVMLQFTLYLCGIESYTNNNFMVSTLRLKLVLLKTRLLCYELIALLYCFGNTGIHSSFHYLSLSLTHTHAHTHTHTHTHTHALQPCSDFFLINVIIFVDLFVDLLFVTMLFFMSFRADNQMPTSSPPHRCCFCLFGDVLTPCLSWLD